MRHFVLGFGYKTAKKTGGFTLIELMVVITIGAMMAATSVYSFNQSNANQLAISISNNIAAALRYARAQAVSQSTAVAVCGASDTTLTACQTAAGATNWNNGWIVFLDSNGNGTITSASTQILQVYPVGGAQPNITINSTTNPFATYGVFSSTGFPSSNKQVNLTAHPVGCTGNYGRTIYLAASGRVTISSYTCP